MHYTPHPESFGIDLLDDALRVFGFAGLDELKKGSHKNITPSELAMRPMEKSACRAPCLTSRCFATASRTSIQFHRGCLRRVFASHLFLAEMGRKMLGAARRRRNG